MTRSEPESTASARRFPAWLMPTGILSGFGLLFAGLYRDRLLPAPAVEVAVVLATADASRAATASPSSASAAPAAPLFQASGWIEPDPYPVKVPALVDGVVSEVKVLEGQDVKKGDPLATLIDEDARLALAAAQGRHRMLESARQAHLAALEAMRRKREAAQAETAAAKTLESEAAQQLERYDRLLKTKAISELETISARLRLQREKSLLQAAEAKDAETAAEVQRMERETQAKEDEIALAAVALSQAELALARTRIVAPMEGRVLRLMAAPGMKKMLAMDEADSSTICVLYQPGKLQARVDVPLADAAGLFPGQRVKLHTSLLSGEVFEGEITRITGEADLQRNTLQVKVRIAKPSDQLRPEMLCRAEFFGRVEPASSAPSGATPSGDAAAVVSPLSLWIPPSAIHGEAAWVCDPETGRLARREIRATGETRDGFVRIAEGLRPGEQVLLTPGGWREGQRVRPTLVSSLPKEAHDH